MKYSAPAFTLLLLLTLAGCSGLQLPVFNRLTATVTPAMTATPEPTATLTLTPTITSTFTITSSPTISPTPTQTPKNFVLAETGYDIADVRLSYPRVDMFIVDFKYRLDENAPLERASIFSSLPTRCGESNYSPHLSYHPDSQVGEGRYVFKMTREGTCAANALDFNIYFFDRVHGTAYQETVDLPYEITRDFPAVSLQTLQVSRFRFEAQAGWRGKFIFEYSLSEKIPIPPEQYHFQLTAADRYSRCYFTAAGPTLTEYSGTYVIDVDAKAQAGAGQENCLDPFAYSGFTFSQLWFSLIDELADEAVFRIHPDLSFRVFNSQ